MGPEPLIRADGNNDSERYLKRLCERSFLTLWSHASVFYDKRANKTGDGKELCDMLVVFGRHVIMFSDKNVSFSDIPNRQLAWERWHRSAVLDAARQLTGAERTLRRAPGRVFIDRRCTVPFPYPVPSAAEAIYHRVVVAHGASAHCREQWGGSGSLKLVPSLRDSASMPFAIGDIDPSGGFVHVLDDTTLDIVMSECDTIADFVDYLSKKESFVRSGRLAAANGEEQLLTCYLAELNAQGEHDFVLAQQHTPILLEDSIYQDYLASPLRAAKKKADAVSYAWDYLIERFAIAVLDGNFRAPASHPTRFEPLLRVFASETRFRRRVLATQLLQFFATSQPVEFDANMRILKAIGAKDPFYLFAHVPRARGELAEVHINRRAETVLKYCQVIRLTYANAHTIAAISVDAPSESVNGEYIYLYDGSVFPDDERSAAQRAQDEHGWLRNEAKHSSFLAYEYPTLDKAFRGQSV